MATKKMLPDRKKRQAAMSLLTTARKTMEAETKNTQPETKKIAPETLNIEPETGAMEAETIFMTYWHWAGDGIF